MTGGKPKMPPWATSSKRLREYAKGRKLKTRYGGFRVIVFGGGAPIGEMWARPHVLRWDDSLKTAYARFQFVDLETGVLTWHALMYHYPLAGFVFDASPGFWGHVMGGAPRTRYYDETQREEVLAKREQEVAQWPESDERRKAKAGVAS